MTIISNPFLWKKVCSNLLSNSNHLLKMTYMSVTLKCLEVVQLYPGGPTQPAIVTAGSLPNLQKKGSFWRHVRGQNCLWNGKKYWYFLWIKISTFLTWVWGFLKLFLSFFFSILWKVESLTLESNTPTCGMYFNNHQYVSLIYTTWIR